MINCDCIFDDSDEDCYKCVKHGYIFGCEGCKDYKTMFDRAKKRMNCSDCAIDNTDACSRGAGRAVDDEICDDFIKEQDQ